MKNQIDLATNRTLSAEAGTDYIELFINGINSIELASKKAGRKIFFRNIFRKDPDRLAEKYSFENFAGFFLNLDNQNQMDLLRYIFAQSKVNLDMPEIPNWKELGKEIFDNKANGIHRIEGGTEIFDFDQENVRSFAVGFKKVSVWDAYPHVKVWVSKFLLYANNNGIGDSEYEGERYGNFPNWSVYFLLIDRSKKTSLVEKLVNYN